MTFRKEIIGDATLYLGDCLEVMAEMEAGSVDAVVTDPPYGIGLGDHAGAKEKRPGLLVKSGGYLDTPEHFTESIVPRVEAALALCSRGVVFGVPPSMWQLPVPRAIGGILVANAVGRNSWGWSSLIHCLLYGSAPGLQHGAKATAIRSAATAEKTGHPVTKPLKWMMWVVGLASQPLDRVIDPFMGGGTTGVACMNLGRKFIGIEIEEKYFDIACRRIDLAARQEKLPLGDLG